ncbi:ABC transporter substrate-binding protein [Roseomonas sp. NAR14]|uniref:ABC transporter substrate-binding protein n=1 Tax=Roseomonas acroporae TaxID=2937791 RepID=A0A9X2BTA7_9PROT|nr:ABC transporter substrate-binding protein [Roseomonas acroporae]MCK8783071.1 ABC transporter substrate-binding protein [Roseomonas acroporae]
MPQRGRLPRRALLAGAAALLPGVAAGQGATGQEATGQGATGQGAAGPGEDARSPAAAGPATGSADAAGTAPAGWPRTVTDALGRAVALPAPPRRIVAIFASNVELLAALGLADRIAGIEAYTRYPPEVLGRPLVGGRLGFSAEAIARLDADLVVMTPARQAAGTLLDPLARIGIPSLVVLGRDLADILGNLRLLGRATGREAAAEAVVAAMERRFAAVRARLAGRPRPRVFLETSNTGRGTYGTVRPDTYTADAVRLAGGDLAFPAFRGPAQVSGEAVLRADPDVILVAGRPDQAAEVASRPGWDSLRAVREGRVHPVSRAFLLIPGPRVADGVEQVARLLHPAAFAG